MGLATAISIAIIIVIIACVIVYIVINNREINHSIKAANEYNAKLGASLFNTQDVVKNSLVTKESVSDIQSALADSLKKNSSILSNSIDKSLSTLESESRTRSANDIQLGNSLATETSARALLQSNFNQHAFDTNASLKGLHQEVTLLNSTFQEWGDSIASLSNIKSLPADVESLKQHGSVISEQIDLINSSILSSFDSIYGLSNSFTSSNISISKGGSLSFADTSSSYMLAIDNSNLSLKLDNNSAFSLGTASNPNLHLIAADGSATHSGGVKIPGNSCISFNVENKKSLPDANKICYGTELNSALNIYGGGNSTQAAKVVRIMDDLEIGRNIRIPSGAIVIGDVALSFDPNNQRLLFTNHKNGSNLAAIYSTPGNQIANRLEVFGLANGADPAFKISSLGLPLSSSVNNNTISLNTNPMTTTTSV